MGGHILWLPSKSMLIAINKILVGIENGNMAEPLFAEIMEPLYTQVALEEQAYVIQKLVKSGMHPEELASRMGCSYHYVEEICGLDLSLEYDYSRINGAVRTKEKRYD